MVITRREVLAMTNILGRIPQTVLNEPDPASTSNFTFSVIEDPPVSPSKGPTIEPSARTDDRDLEEPMTQSSCEDVLVSSGKRRRPKYSEDPHDAQTPGAQTLCHWADRRPEDAIQLVV